MSNVKIPISNLRPRRIRLGRKIPMSKFFIPLEIIPRRPAAWVTTWNHSSGDRNTPREFLTGFICLVNESMTKLLMFMIYGFPPEADRPWAEEISA